MSNYLAQGALNLLALTLLGSMARRNSLLTRQSVEAYLRTLIAVGAAIAAEMGSEAAASAGPDGRAAALACNALGFALTPVIPLLLTDVFGDRHVVIPKWSLVPSGVNLVLSLLSAWLGLIFRVSQANVYSRGPLFFLFAAVSVWNIALLFLLTFRSAAYLPGKKRASLCAMLIFLLAAIVAQQINPALHTIWTGVTLLLLLCYALHCELSSTYDTLTGVYNRRTYESELRRLASEGDLTVVFLDVDEFKKVNDRYGHPHGDYCLARLACVIRRTFQPQGSCFRIGGDEFCVLIPGNAAKKAETAASRMAAEIAAIRRKDPTVPWLSYGIAVFRRADGEPIERAIDRADEALYRSKRKRKAASSEEESI